MADLPSGDRERLHAQQRRQSAQTRVHAAAVRDAAAHARDVAAAGRDQIAALRDGKLEARDAAAAAFRAEAASAREHAARDRELAARDRLQAQSDRQELLAQLQIAETDVLTGARTRAAGLLDLEHEIDRAHRTDDQLVVAYIDVVGLKAVNDEYGHAAGDALLAGAVRAMRNHLRSYDLVVRLGGDEFLCAMPGATREDGRRRFRAVQDALAREPEGCEIRVGFATLAERDSADAIIQRADAELPGAGRQAMPEPRRATG